MTRRSPHPSKPFSRLFLIRGAAVALAMAGLAGCAAESQQAPVSTSNGVGPVSQMPQSPNSLPLGSAVAAPLDNSRINRVRVQ